MGVLPKGRLCQCASLNCSKIVGKNGRPPSCPRCGESLWCSRLCQLRDADRHKESCVSTSDTNPHLTRCLNASCHKPLKPNSSSTLGCQRCGKQDLWCSSFCHIKSEREHQYFCPPLPEPGIFSRALCSIQPTHPTPVIHKRLLVKPVVVPNRYTRSGVFALQSFREGDCIVAEAPEIVIPTTTSLLPLLARSLACKVDLTHTYTLDGRVFHPACTLQTSDNFMQTILRLGATYGHSKAGDLYHQLGVLHHYSIIVQTPLSERTLGRAMYATSSHIQHHCRPNAIRIIDANYRSLLYALEPIKVDQEIYCFHAPSDVCVLPVAGRSHILRHQLRQHCICSACISETEALRLMDQEYGFNARALIDESANVSLNDFWNNLNLKAIPEFRHPLLGEEMISRTMEEAIEAGLPPDELRYIWYNTQYTFQAYATEDYMIRCQRLRSELTMTAPFKDTIVDWERFAQLKQHTCDTMRWIKRGMQQEHPQLEAELVSELFILMRGMMQGAWRTLNKLLTQWLFDWAWDVFHYNCLVLFCTKQLLSLPLSRFAMLELWIRTWSFVLVFHDVMPMDYCIELMNESIDVLEIRPFIPLLRVMVLSELQMNNTVGVFVSLLDAVRDLGQVTPKPQPKRRKKKRKN